jgi:peptide methionine sulfoxide reductase MsrA
VFYHSDQQRIQAQEIKEEVQREHYAGRPVVTEIVAASDFYRAEDYHQKYDLAVAVFDAFGRYLETNPGGYCNHRLRY